MKTVIFYLFFINLLLFGGNSQLKAQETRIFPADFRVRYSLQPVDGGGGFCYLKGAKKKNLTFYIIDEGLNTLVEYPIPISGDFKLTSCTFNGQFYLAEFTHFVSDFPVNKLYFCLFDPSGKLIFDELHTKQNREKISSDRRIFPAENGDFIFVERVRNGKLRLGLAVYRFNANLEEIWQKMYFFDKGHLRLSYADYRAETLVFLVRRDRFSERKSYQSDMIIIDGRDGLEMNRVPLSIEGNTYMPSKPLIEDDGNILLTGPYFRNEKINLTSSSGLFLNKYDREGNVIFKKQQSWGSINRLSELKKNIVATMTSSVKTHPYTVLKQNDKYCVLAEFFGRTVSGASIVGGVLEGVTGNGLSISGLSRLDYVVLEFQKDEPEVINAYSIPKEAELLDLTKLRDGNDDLLQVIYSRDIRRLTNSFEKPKLVVNNANIESNYIDIITQEAEKLSLLTYESYYPITTQWIRGPRVIALENGKLVRCTFEGKYKDGTMRVEYMKD